ncbi:MAG: hypothetical protein ACFN20_08080, partial [Bacteroidota bacterium]
ALYQYNSENQLICSLFQGVGNAIWDSKYIYDKNKKLSEEYIVINGNEKNGFLNKFSSEGRLIEHLTFSSNKLSTFHYNVLCYY